MACELASSVAVRERRLPARQAAPGPPVTKPNYRAEGPAISNKSKNLRESKAFRRYVEGAIEDSVIMTEQRGGGRSTRLGTASGSPGTGRIHDDTVPDFSFHPFGGRILYVCINRRTNEGAGRSFKDRNVL